MTARALRMPLCLLALLSITRPLAAQPLGTYAWQLTPYCNVLVLTATQFGSQYRLEGYDDQCGAARRAAATGFAVPNSDGTLEFGLTVVTATSAMPAHIDITFDLPTLGGPWRDSAGGAGVLVFNPSMPATGFPRPMPVPNPSFVQKRITAACSAGQFIRAVNAEGTVVCGDDTAGASGITGITAGTGLTGGGTTGQVSLSVAFAGSGSGNTAARGDHTHALGLTNVAVGPSALAAHVDGLDNTAIGRDALAAAGTGNGNVAVGSQALSAMTGGGSNVAVGREALRDGTGSNNTAVGYRSQPVSTGHSNASIGGMSLYFNSTGSQNTALGGRALLNNTTGIRNIAIGYEAGDNQTTGDDNIYIVASGQAGENGATRIGGGGTTAAYISGIAFSNIMGANVLVAASGRLGVAVSSSRFKDQVAGLGDVRSKLQALRPVSFVYKPEFDDGTRQTQYGLIAEEVDAVMPELVVRDEQGRVQTVRYQFLPPLLLAEVQHLEREHADQDRRVTTLERELAELRALIERR